MQATEAAETSARIVGAPAGYAGRVNPGVLPDGRRLRILSITTMFPSDGLPVHAVFVRNRLREIATHAELRVVSPVPVFPVATRAVPKYRPRLSIPREQVHPATATGARIFASYPHHLSVPGFLKPLDGPTVAWSVRREMKRLAREEGFVPDVLDAHLAFPEGFAASFLARLDDLPMAITLRGHDINDLHNYPVRWKQVQYALKRADRVIGVCRALVDGAIDAGADPARSVVVSNGVDPTMFKPMDRAKARERLGLPPDAPVIVSVGHMVPRKGFHVLADALGELKRRGRDDVYMVFIGAAGEEGDFLAHVKSRVAAHGLEARIRFEGAVHPPDIPQYHSAADVFALATEKEGWPNVLFEALACGCPVVVTDTWGTPECVCRPEFGVLVPERTPEAFADALGQALDTEWDRDALVAYARANTWTDVGFRALTELRRAYELHRGAAFADTVDLLGPPQEGPAIPGEARA